MVILQRWEETSTSGAKARFGLPDKDALTPFEKATKRRGKRAGQRYLLIVADRNGEPIPTAPEQCFLAGAQWSHGSGASITLAFQDIGWWKRFSTGDHDDAAGERFHFTMVEIQEDETPIDQASQDLVERANKPKGGPKSKFVAQRNQAKDFQEFVGYRMDTPQDRWALIGADTCDKWVKQMCGVASKIEFDHNPEAWIRYERLISRPFMTWARSYYGDSYGKWSSS
jgi:hypothetical protein